MGILSKEAVLDLIKTAEHMKDQDFTDTDHKWDDVISYFIAVLDDIEEEMHFRGTDKAVIASLRTPKPGKPVKGFNLRDRAASLEASIKKYRDIK